MFSGNSSAIEYRHLQYFVAVAEELNFRRAAARLFVAQPSLSQQIQELERRLNVRLFDRNTRGVVLTAPGKYLYTEAVSALRHRDAFAGSVRSLEPTRALAIGCVGGALQQHGSELLPTLSQMSVELVHADLGDPTAGLADGSVDMALAWWSPELAKRYPSLVFDPVLVEPSRCVTLSTSRIRKPRKLSALLPQLLQSPYPGLSELGGHHPYPRRRSWPRSPEEYLSAVELGMGIALLPLSVAKRIAGSGLRIVELLDPPLVTAGVLYHPTRKHETAILAILSAIQSTAKHEPL
jgi:DNA-binding transcriptional LysR family regulator